jgi:hypothetical protein
MPVETEWQTRIIKSTRAAGGYGRKWSSQFQIGVPDLILSHSTCGPVFMEVKRETDCVYPCRRKLDLTSKQHQELRELERAGAQVCVGVVFEWRKSEKERPILVVINDFDAQVVSPVRIDDIIGVSEFHSRYDLVLPWRNNKDGFDMKPFFDQWV